MTPQFQLEIVKEDNTLQPSGINAKSKEKLPSIGDKIVTYNANWYNRKVDPDLSTGRFIN